MRGKALTAADGPGARICFSTRAGDLEGWWRGAYAVAVGDEVDVELELPESRDWSNVEVVGEARPTDPRAYESPYVEGIVLDVDQDGVLCLDVLGTPLMVETTGQAPHGIVGKWVRLFAQDLEFHPMGI